MPAANLILKNADVITMDARQPAAQMVAIKDDKILLVGDNDEVAGVKGTGTREIDCHGKTVVPSFNDAHCHVFSLIRKLLSLDLSPPSVKSISDMKAAIRQRLQNIPAGEWLSATGYNEFYLAEKRHPTRWDIDEVAPQHPVVLAHCSLHACVLNSIALSRAGITPETPEPPGGRIDRDPSTGEPNGVLFEMLGYIREKVTPPLSEAEMVTGISLANKHYLSVGITSLQDATVVNDFDRWQLFRRFKDSGQLKSRLYMMFGAEKLPRFREQGLAFGAGDNQLRLGGVKLMLNEATGELQPPQSELNRQALAAHRAGFPVAIHAVEQESVAAAITALEYLRDQFPRVGQRHRIEHCSQCPPRLLRRLSQLPAVVVTQPTFLYYSGERYLATLPASHLRWLYRIGSLRQSGLVVAASSDGPVVPDNPLVGIYAAVTRQAESGQKLLPQEAISAAEALAMYTLDAAHASFEDKIKGSITPGKLADMVVLSDNPLTAPPEAIRDIRVKMTIIGGKIVWEA